MNKPIKLRVRVTGRLSEFIAANIGEDGLYENASEYVRDLIRRDRARFELEKFEALKAELKRTISTLDGDFKPLKAEALTPRP